MKRILLILPLLAVLPMFLTVVSLADTGSVNLLPAAVIDAPECNRRDDASAIADGICPDASFGGTHLKYSSHNFADGYDDSDNCDNFETITFTWDSPVTVDTFAVFFACSAPERELWLRFGGEDVPAFYSLEYLRDGEYEPVPSPAGLECHRDKMNVTTFFPVTTTSLRMVITRLTEDELNEYVYKKAFESGGNLTEGLILNSLGIGIYEIEIYAIPEEETESPVDTDVPDETTNEPADTDIPNETTNEPADTDIPDETTNEPADTDVPDETTDEPADTDVPDETTDEPADTDVPDETTNEPADTDVPDETTSEPADTDVPDETTNEPADTDGPDETTNEPADTDGPDETTDESADTDDPDDIFDIGDVTAVPKETTGISETSGTPVTSPYLNEGSAFDGSSEPPSTKKIVTAAALFATAAMVIAAGALIFTKKNR